MTDTSVLNGFSHIGSALLAPDTLLVGAAAFIVWKVYSSIYICS
jgi:hypothetical protein